MSRKKMRLLGLIVYLFLICSPMSVFAGNVRLTLVANNNGGGNLGHSFLVVKNTSGNPVYLSGYRIPKGETISIGRRFQALRN